MSTATLMISFFGLLLMNVPIAVCLGLSSVFTYLSLGMSFNSIPINYYAASNKFVLLAIPFFILGGNIMEKVGFQGNLLIWLKLLWATFVVVLQLCV